MKKLGTLPFEPMPQIVRYLETILDLEDKFYAQTSGDAFLIPTYIEGEDRNHKTELMNTIFWRYLEKIQAIEYLTTPLTEGDDNIFVKYSFIEGQRNMIGYKKKQKIRVLDVKRVSEIYECLKTVPVDQDQKRQTADKYEISIKDRELWINNTYLLSKPFAVGSNFEFFLYLFENTDKEINEADLPIGIRKEINGKRFHKILNALGFKGEILKAFFPKRGNDKLIFKKRVTGEEILERGIDKDIFLKELDLAHAKNSPK